MSVQSDLDAAFERWFDGLPESDRDAARRAWDRTMQADAIRLHHALRGLIFALPDAVLHGRRRRK